MAEFVTTHQIASAGQSACVLPQCAMPDIARQGGDQTRHSPGDLHLCSGLPFVQLLCIGALPLATSN